MFRTRRFVVAAGCAVLALHAFSASARGQTFWVPSAGGNWFDSPNWDAGVPNAAGAWGRFGRIGTGSQTVTVNGTATVGRLTFGPTFSSSNFAHTLSGGAISLNNNGSAAIIERTLTDGDSVIQTPITIGGTGALTLNAGGFSGGPALNTLTLASLTGTNSTVTVNATGTTNPGLVVIQSGTYGGITDVRGGVLRANDGTGLPSNTSLRLNGAAWEQTTAATITRSLGTGAGNIQLPGGTSGFAAFNGLLTIRLNGGGQIQWGTTNFNPTTLRFGRGVTAGGSDVYQFENGLDLNGATRTIAVGVGAGGVRAYAKLTGNVVNTSGTTSGLTVTGAGGGGGTVELSGTNTYNGNTTVQSLTSLRANEGAGLSPNTTLVLNGGILENLGAATFSRPLGTAAGSVRVIGGTSGFAAFGGTHTIQLNGGTGTVVWGSVDFSLSSSLQFGSFNADAMTDFRNGIDLNGATRFITTRDNTNSTADFVRLSGVISNSTGTAVLVVGGNGVVEMTAANTYTSDTYITDSAVLPNTVLRLAGSGSFANSPTITVGVQRSLDVTGLTGGANYSATAGRFLVAPNQTLAGSGTVTGNVLVGPGATIKGGSPSTGLNDPTGQLTVSGALRLGGNAFAPATLAVDLNGTATSGATVSRVAVIGAANTTDFAVAGNGPVALRLLNDQNLALGQSYGFQIASAEGGFTRDGVPVTAFTYGTDFVIVSSNFAAFSGVSLTVNGSNLTLQFTPTPVPEPGVVLGVAGGLALALRFRRQLAARFGVT